MFHPLALVRARRYKEAITDPENPVSWGLLKPEGAHLWHFDGSLVSTDGISPESGAVATLRPDGRFGGAVAVEEGTTNCIASRDFETWTSYATDNATGTVEFRQDPIYGKVVKLKKTDGGSGRFGLGVTLSGLSGSIYTHSVYVRALSGTGRICMWVDAARTGGGLITSTSYSNLSDLPRGQRVRIVATADGSPDTLAGGGHTYIWVDIDNGECEFAYPQVEPKPFATSFVDGTRAGGVLDYSIQLSSDFTIAFYWWVPISQLGNKDRSVLALSNGTNVLNFFQGYGPDWYLGDEMNRTRFLLANFAPAAYTIYHIVLRRQGEVVSVFRDGALWDAVDFGAAPNFTTLRLGGLSPQLNWPNSVYDELLILPYAATPEQIQAWYNMGVPFYDADRLAKRYLRRMEMLGWYIPPNPTP